MSVIGSALTAAAPEAPPALESLEAVGALYAAQATRVRRLVHLQVSAPDAVVEDACQVAWLRLVAHRGRIRRDGAVRWLVRVAVREVRRMLARTRRDVPLDAGVEFDELGTASRSAAPPLVEDLAEARSRLHAIGSLPARQQRLVWLQGIGLSYAEMSRWTGETPRTVERQLLRARRRLARGEPGETAA